MTVGHRAYALGDSVVPRAPRKPPAPPATASFEKPFERMRVAYERDAADVLEQLRDREPTAHLLDPLLARSRQQTKTTGRQRLAKLQRTLDLMGLKRSKNQREFHREMTKSVLRQLFREDLAENLESLYEEFAVDDFDSCVMIVTPRRWGKTTAVAMFVVAVAAAIESVEQSIFSTGRRASQKLLELIYHLLCRVPGMKESIVKKNVETIWIRGPGGEGDLRKIGSYPSKVKIEQRSTDPQRFSGSSLRRRAHPFFLTPSRPCRPTRLYDVDVVASPTMHWWIGALTLLLAAASVVAIVAGAADLSAAPCLVPAPVFTLPAWLLVTGIVGAVAVIFFGLAYSNRHHSYARWLWAVFTVAFVVIALPMLIIGTDLLLRARIVANDRCSFTYGWSIVTLVIAYLSLVSSILWIPALVRLEVALAHSLVDDDDEPVRAAPRRRRRAANNQDFSFDDEYA